MSDSTITASTHAPLSTATLLPGPPPSSDIRDTTGSTRLAARSPTIWEE
jgi:hypothetical protein